MTISLLSALTGLAQRPKPSQEVGVFIGGSYYNGELNPTKQFDQFTQPAAGLVFRYNFNPRLAARFNALYGSIQGDDSFSNSPAQIQRNLSFKSDIYELSSQLEFNFLDYEIGNEKHGFTPYIFGGLAIFHFNPQTKVKGNWVDLQPLGTEGQGLPGAASSRKYMLTQISLPFGIGIKANLAKSIGVSLEWGMRKTFTDYLDDVSTTYYDPAKLAATHGALAAQLSDPSIGTDPKYSNVGKQRGNPTTTDWYSFAGVALTVKIKQKRKTCPGVYK